MVLNQTKIVDKSSTCSLHVGWCVIDPKVTQKHLHMLNEMGVKKLTLVYSEFSQKNFKPDLKRLNRIIINSCEQCGRSDLMEIEIVDTLKEYLEMYPKSIVIDFSDRYLEEPLHVESFLVGPEGGFSQKERELFKNREVYGLRCANILRSETVVVGICAKVTL